MLRELGLLADSFWEGASIHGRYSAQQMFRHFLHKHWQTVFAEGCSRSGTFTRHSLVKRLFFRLHQARALDLLTGRFSCRCLYNEMLLCATQTEWGVKFRLNDLWLKLKGGHESFQSSMLSSWESCL